MSSFIKDRDAHTRGVNAIAAADGAGSAGRRREMQKVRAMHRRDRMMAQLADSAFKPDRQIQEALGRVNLTGTKPLPVRGGGHDLVARPTPRPGPAGSGYGGGGGGPISGGGLLSRFPLSPTTGGAMVSNRPTMRPPQGTIGRNPLVGGGSPMPFPGSASQPSSPSPTSPYPSSTSSGSSAGSASSGSSSAGSGGAWTDVPPTDDQAMTDLLEPATITEAPSNTKKYLLIAGACVGAYLLYQHHKKG